MELIELQEREKKTLTKLEKKEGKEIISSRETKCRLEISDQIINRLGEDLINKGKMII